MSSKDMKRAVAVLAFDNFVQGASLDTDITKEDIQDYEIVYKSDFDITIRVLGAKNMPRYFNINVKESV